jgi:hypothetical protein
VVQRSQTGIMLQPWRQCAINSAFTPHRTAQELPHKELKKKPLLNRILTCHLSSRKMCKERNWTRWMLILNSKGGPNLRQKFSFLPWQVCQPQFWNRKESIALLAFWDSQHIITAMSGWWVTILLTKGSFYKSNIFWQT